MEAFLQFLILYHYENLYFYAYPDDPSGEAKSVKQQYILSVEQNMALRDRMMHMRSFRLEKGHSQEAVRQFREWEKITDSQISLVICQSQLKNKYIVSIDKQRGGPDD